jgi:membrane-associated phospholipid phosphatase
MKIKLFILINLFWSIIILPQDELKPRHDVSNFFKVGGDVFTSPSKFDSKDWIILGSSIGLTTGAFLIDEEIKSFALSNQNSFNDALFEMDKYYHIEFMAAGIGALYIYGLSADNYKVRNLALRLTEATVFASLINLGTKFVLGRGRPQVNESATNFKLFNTTWEFTSLPSGHSTLSFAYSTVLAGEYKNFFWKFGWYTAAALVGAARIYHNVHWFSDVVLGAAIGYAVGEFVNNHKSNNPKNYPPNEDFNLSFRIQLD